MSVVFHDRNLTESSENTEVIPEGSMFDVSFSSDGSIEDFE